MSRGQDLHTFLAFFSYSRNATLDCWWGFGPELFNIKDTHTFDLADAALSIRVFALIK